jgi:hypothetical protein
VVGSVDDYIGKLPVGQAKVVRLLRAAIKRSGPSLSEGIKWGQPVYETNGPICYLKAHRAHITFGFWRGVELMPLCDLLETNGKKMAHLKIATAGDVDQAVVKRLVAAAIKLNADKRDRNKRGMQTHGPR